MLFVVQTCAQGCSAAAQHSSAQQARPDCGQPALSAAFALPADSPQSCTSQVAPWIIHPYPAQAYVCVSVCLTVCLSVTE